jgi:hypothetical protein
MGVAMHWGYLPNDGFVGYETSQDGAHFADVLVRYLTSTK